MAEKLDKEPLENEDKIVQEATLSRIRNLINENKIKLWETIHWVKHKN